MGHIINPISQRLGYSQFWSTNWALSASTKNYSYSFLSAQSALMIKYLKKLFVLSMKRLFGRGTILLDFKIFKVNQQTTIILESRVKQITSLRRLIDLLFLNSINLRYTIKKSIWLQNEAYTNRGVTFIKNNNKVVATEPLTIFGHHKYVIRPKFIRKTGKLTRYVSTVMQPDLYAYPWLSFLTLLGIKTRGGFINASISKGAPNKIILQSFIKYILATQWISNLHHIMLVATKNFYVTTQPVKILLNILSGVALTASFIARYLATRLLQKFPLRKLLTALIKQLQAAQLAGHIHGFKIMCNGRFERRGRATHVWKISGKVPRSNVNFHVDYAMMLPVLTNSICAIKVWITKVVSSEKILLI